jgi:hypothetical protein
MYALGRLLIGHNRDQSRSELNPGLMAAKPAYGPLTVSLDEKMRTRLRRIAFSAGVSTSAIVVDALEQYLDAKDSEVIERVKRSELPKRR